MNAVSWAVPCPFHFLYTVTKTELINREVDLLNWETERGRSTGRREGERDRVKEEGLEGKGSSGGCLLN